MTRRKKICIAIGSFVVFGAVIACVVFWRPWADGVSQEVDAIPAESEKDGREEGYSADASPFGEAAEGAEESLRSSILEKRNNGGQEYEYERVYLDDGTSYDKGRILVFFFRSYGEARAREIVEEMGGEWRDDVFGWDTGEEAHVTVYFSGDVDEQALCKQFEEYREVSLAVCEKYGDGSWSLFESENEMEPLQKCQTYLDVSRFSEAWSVQKGMNEIRVAIIDTGIDFDHEDLQGSIIKGLSYDAKTNMPFGSGYSDSDLMVTGHGTMVAGVIAAIANNNKGIAGCAYGIDVIPIRIPAKDDDFKWEYFLNALEFLEQLPDSQLPDVVNMSFSMSEESLDESELKQIIGEKLSELRDERKVMFVAAGGNLHSDETPEMLYERVYPAAFSEVIAVGNVNSDGIINEQSKRYSEIALCAPGVLAYTTLDPDCNEEKEQYGDSVTTLIEYDGRSYPYQSEISGTSFAAPQVAAAAALVKRANPGFTAEQVERALVESAVKLDAMGGKSRTDEYGYGMLDAYAAVMWSPQTSGGGSGSVTPSYAAGGSAYEAFLASREG